MTITVSGVSKEVNEGISIAELIRLENVSNSEYVSVSVNEEFIDRDAFDTHALKGNDIVEFLYFMGGGQDRKEM